MTRTQLPALPAGNKGYQRAVAHDTRCTVKQWDCLANINTWWRSVGALPVFLSNWTAYYPQGDIRHAGLRLF